MLDTIPMYGFVVFHLTVLSVSSAFYRSRIARYYSTLPRGLGIEANHAMTTNDDPFAVFHEDGDDDTENISITPSTIATTSRDAANGPMSYHEGVEQALLQYIRNKLDFGNAVLQEVVAATTRSETVIKLVDEFCMTRHWMMHIGPEKGTILDNFLKKCLQTFDQSNVANEPFVVLEIGTYCGYSTIRLLHFIRQHLQGGHKFHILTVDVNPQHQAVARQLIDLAGFSEYVTFLLLNKEKTVGEAVWDTMKEQMPDARVRFVFLDHEKVRVRAVNLT
jgi:catechol O-methyltransferase